MYKAKMEMRQVVYQALPPMDEQEPEKKETRREKKLVNTMALIEIFFFFCPGPARPFDKSVVDNLAMFL
jgi:hypothetical protein